MKENAFENNVCKLSAISFWPRCAVNLVPIKQQSCELIFDGRHNLRVEDNWI